MSNVIKFDSQAYENRKKYIGFFPEERRISVLMPKGWAFRTPENMQVHIAYWEPKGMRIQERFDIINFYQKCLQWQIDVIEYELGDI